jgi:hypothetical protein
MALIWKKAKVGGRESIMVASLQELDAVVEDLIDETVGLIDSA